MLPSQRALFDIPREVCFLDAGFAAGQHERARRAAARLINADPEDVALISSVSYGVATAAKVLTVPAGSRVLVLENDHSSVVLEWMTRASAGRFTVDIVLRPQEDASGSVQSAQGSVHASD